MKEKRQRERERSRKREISCVRREFKCGHHINSLSLFYTSNEIHSFVCVFFCMNWNVCWTWFRNLFMVHFITSMVQRMNECTRQIIIMIVCSLINKSTEEKKVCKSEFNMHCFSIELFHSLMGVPDTKHTSCFCQYSLPFPLSLSISWFYLLSPSLWNLDMSRYMKLEWWQIPFVQIEFLCERIFEPEEFRYWSVGICLIRIKILIAKARNPCP